MTRLWTQIFLQFFQNRQFQRLLWSLLFPLSNKFQRGTSSLLNKSTYIRGQELVYWGHKVNNTRWTKLFSKEAKMDHQGNNWPWAILVRDTEQQHLFLDAYKQQSGSRSSSGPDTGQAIQGLTAVALIFSSKEQHETKKMLSFCFKWWQNAELGVHQVSNLHPGMMGHLGRRDEIHILSQMMQSLYYAWAMRGPCWNKFCVEPFQDRWREAKEAGKELVLQVKCLPFISHSAVDAFSPPELVLN